MVLVKCMVRSLLKPGGIFPETLLQDLSTYSNKYVLLAPLLLLLMLLLVCCITCFRMRKSPPPALPISSGNFTFGRRCSVCLSLPVMDRISQGWSLGASVVGCIDEGLYSCLVCPVCQTPTSLEGGKEKGSLGSGSGMLMSSDGLLPLLSKIPL